MHALKKQTTKYLNKAIMEKETQGCLSSCDCLSKLVCNCLGHDGFHVWTRRVIEILG